MKQKFSSNFTVKMYMTAMLSIAVMFLCMGIGSVYVTPSEIFAILRYKLFSAPLPEAFDASKVSILWSIRLPRAVTAFLTGGMLSVGGVVMQSVLQNPLASSYTLGVSSGASLGASLVIVSGLSAAFPFGSALLPAAGFLFGLGTVFLVLAVSSMYDRSAASHTVILFGMVLSLFLNAVLTVISSLHSEHAQRLILWQMGSFSGKRWFHPSVLLPCAVIGILFLLHFHRELDIMTFGDEQASALGIDLGRTKKMTLTASAFLTGVCICFTGTIGFVDLIVPHLVHRLFGAASSRVLVMSFFVGGALLSLADLVSRTLLAPREIPVGAVTALLGAPFFIHLYFGGRRRL